MADECQQNLQEDLEERQRKNQGKNQEENQEENQQENQQENLNEHDSQPDAVKGDKVFLGHMLFLIKISEIILAVLVIGLIADPLISFQRIMTRTHLKLNDAAMIYITVAGYLIINTLFFICQLLGDEIPKRTLLVFSSVGAQMHLVAGGIIVYNWKRIYGRFGNNNEAYPSKQYMDMFISGAVFTFVNGIVLFLEVCVIIHLSKIAAARK
ncbi:hypothetical protein K0M31_019775 [Melipona bicolor]|uniref:Uncharacterized protein n=1 Tax=Melipona bicolor TaxID=60889 RepID=A0AA40G327_9HYME|nr:hypothetical protein K0M31_019775 [Melipona bicolor]